MSKEGKDIQALDKRIATLVPDIDETLRTELQQLLGTLRNEGYVPGVIVGASRLVDGPRGLLERVASVHNYKLKGHNLEKQIEELREKGILPSEIASDLHWIRVRATRARHNIERLTLTVYDAETALNFVLGLIEWFYCKCEHDSRLPTIYTAEPVPPVTLTQMLETFLQAQRDTEEGRRRLEAELERIRNQQAAIDQRRRELVRERIVGPVPSAVAEHFKDRVAELGSLREKLTDENLRLILVCGRGGMGKTALITKLLHEVRQDFTLQLDAAACEVDSIVYVALHQSEFRSSSKIIELLCRTLEPSAAEELREKWKEQTSLPDKLEFLFHRILNRQRCLIVLDNLEDVLDNDNCIREEFSDLGLFVEKCLEYDHGAKVVATSRRTLVLSTELEGRIGGRRAEISLDSGLPEDDAVELLRELDADGRLGIKGAPDATLSEVARRCHGIPHTLRALVGTLSQRRTHKLTWLLDDEAAFASLTDNPARELYESLSPEQRLVVQVLAVYDRPVPAAAVSYLLPALPVDDLLDTLVRNYVVTYDRASFSLHPLDQQYAYHRIPEEGEDYTKLALHHRAAGYYRQVRKPESEWKTLEDIGPQLQEYEHLYRAEEYEEACGLLNTCMDYLDLWKDRLNQWGYLTMTDMYARLLKHITDPRLAGDILFGIALSHSHYGSSSECLTFCEQAIAKAVEAGHEHTKAKALRLMTWIYHEDNAHLNDLSYLEEALRIFHIHGDWKEEIMTFCDLARACFEKGQLEKAKLFAEQGLARVQSLPHEVAESRLYHTLGRIYAAKEEWEAALQNYHAALKLFEEMSNRGGEAAVKRRIGVALMKQEKYEEALDYYKAALSIDYELESHNGIALELYEMGRCYYNMAPAYRKDALTSLLAAKRIHDEIGMKHPEAPVDKFLNEIKVAIGAEEYERLVGEIDLSQSEYLDSSCYHIRRT